MLADRDSSDGMGYVILRKNKSIFEQITKPNTIYEIRYDYTVENNLNIPEGCVLHFTTGSLSGAKLICYNTTFSGNIRMSNPISGSIYNTELSQLWFSDFQYFESSICETSGYNIVKFKKGEYTLSRELVFNTNVTTVEGNDAIIRITDANYLITNERMPNPIEIGNLTENVERGAISFKCENTNLLKKGDVVLLRDNTPNSYSHFRDYRQGEYLEVYSIQGNEVFITEKIYGDYINLQNCKIYKKNFSKINISNLNIIANRSNLTDVYSAIILYDIKSSYISNINMLDFTYGLRIYNAIDVSIDKIISNNVARLEVQDNYGISTANCQGLTITNCRLIAGNHGLALGSSTGDNIDNIAGRHYHIENVVGYSTRNQNGLDVHGGCEMYKFINCRCSGIALRGNYSDVIGTVLEYDSRVPSQGISLRERTGLDCNISNNTYTGKYFISCGDIPTKGGNLVISNNNINILNTDGDSNNLISIADSASYPINDNVFVTFVCNVIT